MRCLRCHICQFITELPALGGVRQLPQNYMLVRRIEALRLQAGDDVISRVWCSLCSDEISVSPLIECVSRLNLFTSHHVGHVPLHHLYPESLHAVQGGA